MNENTFFIFGIIATGILIYSIYVSFTTDYWYAFVGGIITWYLIVKNTDPKRK